MDIKLFDSFAGIGALHKALKNIGIDVELVGMSEIDIEAIRAYNAIHYNKTWEEIEIPSKEEMEKFLYERNIGLDFKTGKCKLPKGEKLKEVYRICKALNNFGDISLIKPEELPDFDLFNFSFVCVDISVAGRQKGLVDENGNLTRSGLYVYGMDIIKAKRPMYVMIENVKNLVSKKFKSYFDSMLQELEEMGYNTYWKVLNAKDYGIPQNRERVFVICIRKDVDNGSFKFPQPFDNGLRLKDFLDKEVDEKYYIPYERVKELIEQSKKGHVPNNNLEVQITHALSSREYENSGWKDVCPTLLAKDYKDSKVVAEHIEVRPCLTPNRINKRQNGRRFKEDGEPSFTLTTQDIHGVLITENKCIQVGNLEGEKWDKMHEVSKRVYSEEGLAPTIHTCSGGNTEPKILTKECRGLGGNTGLYLDNYKIRKLTPEECYRLMGFSEEDIKRVRGIGMSDSQMYKQAGNSIVVNVLEHIFENLLIPIC